MLLAILVIQEHFLILAPNIQLTVALLVVYATILPKHLLFILVLAYVVLDSVLMGSLNLLYFPPMLIAWFFLVFIARLLRNQLPIWTMLFAFFYGFIYGWLFIPFAMIERGIRSFWPYLLADLPFEIIMAVNNFFTVLLLYNPLTVVLKPLFANGYRP